MSNSDGGLYWWVIVLLILAYIWFGFSITTICKHTFWKNMDDIEILIVELWPLFIAGIIIVCIVGIPWFVRSYFEGKKKRC